MVAQSNASLTPFPHSIAHKLDDLTFLLWCQQAEPVTKSHRLQRFVVNPQIPLHFLSKEDREAGIENPAYKAWEQLDQVLLTWLQACQLQTQLRATNLVGKSMGEFLSQIKALSDALASIGSLIMLQEHIDSIFEGHPSDITPSL